MLLESEGRDDREKEMLLQDISTAEFVCEMLKQTSKTPKTQTKNLQPSSSPNV